MTSPQIVKEDWLKSSILESLVEANTDAIVSEAKRLLHEWIAKFVYSFQSSRLRDTLENSYFLRENGELHTTSGVRSGLAVIIRPRTLSEFKFLLSKSKQIRYRLLKRDPEVQFLLLTTPNLKHIAVTDVLTGQTIDVLSNGEVAE